MMSKNSFLFTFITTPGILCQNCITLLSILHVIFFISTFCPFIGIPNQDVSIGGSAVKLMKIGAERGAGHISEMST